jgi:uncharacterized protein (DUF1800 family)
MQHTDETKTNPKTHPRLKLNLEACTEFGPQLARSVKSQYLVRGISVKAAKMGLHIGSLALIALAGAGISVSAQATDAMQTDAAPQNTAKAFAMQAKLPLAHSAPKALALTPLTQRERVEQLLDRFTFGPRPGDVDHVLAIGADKWVDQQMNPSAINDDALKKRLGNYPTVAMTTEQLVAVFPDGGQVNAVADGKVSYPGDTLLTAMYEVQTYKRNQDRDQKKADGSVTAKAERTDAEKAAQKKVDQETAARIFGELYALPKSQRMATLVKMPVEDIITFTTNGNLTNDQKNLLLADFSPREAETFRAMSGHLGTAYNIGDELAQARMLRDVLSERQLLAVMTNFWFNHFNIYVPKDSDQWYTTSYERDVIAKNALGKFSDLLLATAHSPAMMVYLDNWQSIGPDSLVNGVNPTNPKSKKGNKGLNENYGREVMELHTVGVNGGYTQADVTALSAILTGWGVDKPNEGGGFLFDPKRHEPGPKVWMGYLIQEDGTYTRLPPGAKRTAPTFGPGVTPAPLEVATADSEKQGIAALHILAASPQTARFISTLLAQYFVADKPPATLIDRLQKIYMQSQGDIQTMLRALIASPEFNSRQYFRNKVKTPEEYVASAFRATGTDPQNPSAMTATVRTMGMELYHALPPTGYYLTADQWMSSTALVDRLNFAYQLTNGKFANQKFDAPKLLAVGLLGSSGTVVAANGSGTDLATKVLEATVIGAPVSARTNLLIQKQVQALPPGASAGDTLNLLAALVMGTPEFQLR